MRRIETTGPVLCIRTSCLLQQPIASVTQQNILSPAATCVTFERAQCRMMESCHAIQGSCHAIQGSCHAIQGSCHAIQGSCHVGFQMSHVTDESDMPDILHMNETCRTY